MAPKVPTMEIGTATLGMSVARKLRRKKVHDERDQYDRHHQVSSVSCNEARIVVLRSMATATFISAGMAASRCGNSAFTLSMVSMMLAFGWRKQDDQDRRLSVGHAEIAHILNGVLNVGDIREAHRGTVAIGDHERR
jgi:hypothetical protein